jgi:hypothetical protein
MTDQPPVEFGHRKPQVASEPAPPVKRSRHVALLLMGTVAVGSTAYALMPPENCTPEPTPPGVAATTPAQTTCTSWRWSSWGHGTSGGGSSTRASLLSSDAASSSPSTSTSTSENGHVVRGGFGSFASAFGTHFSFGG